MKQFLTAALSALLALSAAAPAFAMPNYKSVPKLSRRLVQGLAVIQQRVPQGALPSDILLRERAQAQKDVTGRSDLTRSQITTRIRTIRGGTPEARQYWKVARPSRRAIIDKAFDSMLELPALIVETGGKGARTVSRASRRTVRVQTRISNVVKVQAAVNR